MNVFGQRHIWSNCCPLASINLPKASFAFVSSLCVRVKVTQGDTGHRVSTVSGCGIHCVRVRRPLCQGLVLTVSGCGVHCVRVWCDWLCLFLLGGLLPHPRDCCQEVHFCNAYIPIPDLLSNPPVLFKNSIASNSRICVCVCVSVRACACTGTHLVMSISLHSHGQQPARLLCPWNFPSKNTGVGCYFLLQGIIQTQGSNLCLWYFLHWQVDSLPLCHLGSP